MNYYKLTYRFPSYPSDGQGISFKFARTEAEAKERAQKALRVKAEFLKVELALSLIHISEPTRPY